jgi:3-oxoacyl-[acyl-carrier protein] reductase
MGTTDKRVAVVTGASRGIGRAIAERLASDGRHVVLVARSEGPLGDVAGSIEANGGSASAVTCDMGDRAAVAAMIDSVVEAHGRLDILVNNAGITRDNLVLRMSDEEWDDVINVNLTAPFVACRAAARPMMRGKFGRIVNIASTSGVVGNAGQANYAAAKSGLIGLTKSLARELGAKNITANVIAPGFVETDMTAALGDELKQRVLAGMALRELGQAGDIAAMVAAVTGDDARYLTGQVICVDGGLTMC